MVQFESIWQNCEKLPKPFPNIELFFFKNSLILGLVFEKILSKKFLNWCNLHIKKIKKKDSSIWINMANL
jgi:hypothetical protein